MASKTNAQPKTSPPPSPAPRGPEKKFGPYPGGIGVAVWLNTIQTPDASTRKVRSITIAPRRYYDRQTDEWRDSGSYFPGDIAALLFALSKAQEYILTSPIPGEEAPDDRPTGKDDIPY